jgi:RNA polymerase sigma-70 factor (ECF subfamily)
VNDEATLVARLRSPHTREAAFRELVSKYQRQLYYHIRGIVLNHDDADDVLQNTFIKVFRGIDGFKEESKLYTWLYRIATNESISFLNQKAKKYQITSEVLVQTATENLAADVYFEGDAFELALQKAIHQLPPKQQLVFKMKYFEDMTYEDLSEILQTSVGALKASYHHAVKKIEEMLTSH